MKTIYTSNYARKGNHQYAIAISVRPPDYYNGKWCNKLAPTWNLVNDYKNHIISATEYAIKYIELLENRQIFPQELVDSIPDGAFLLCFEKPSDFCHREVLAKWLNDNTNVSILEWKTAKELQADKQVILVESLLGF